MHLTTRWSCGQNWALLQTLRGPVSEKKRSCLWSLALSSWVSWNFPKSRGKIRQVKVYERLSSGALRGIDCLRLCCTLSWIPVMFPSALAHLWRTGVGLLFTKHTSRISFGHHTLQSRSWQANITKLKKRSPRTLLLVNLVQNWRH